MKQEKKTSARAWAEKQQEKSGPTTAVKLPDGVEYLKFKEKGKRRVDVIPYRAGKGNKWADEGSLHFEREYSVHRIPVPGGDKGLYVCLKDFHKVCPICEWINGQLKRGLSEKEEKAIKGIRAQTRHLFNVIDMDGDGKKIRVWDMNHYNKGQGFGEMLAAAIQSDPDAYENFCSLKGGYYLQLMVGEDTFPTASGNKTWYPVTRIDFKKRAKDLPSSILDDTVCLDECIVEMSYDELKKLIDGESEEEENDAESPEDSDGVPEEEEKEKTSPKKPKSKKKDVDEDDVEEDDDEDDEDEEEEDEEEDEEDEPAKAKKGSSFKKEHEEPKSSSFKKGDAVTYKGESWTVLAINEEGQLKIENEDGDILRGIEADEVKAKNGKASSPVKKSKPKKDEDEDEDDDPIEEDEEDD